jgi:hypothetical protein
VTWKGKVREKEREREDKRMGKLASGGEVDLPVGRSREADRNQAEARKVLRWEEPDRVGRRLVEKEMSFSNLKGGGEHHRRDGTARSMAASSGRTRCEMGKEKGIPDSRQMTGWGSGI